MRRTDSPATGYAPPKIPFDPAIDDFVPKERKYIHFDLPLSKEQQREVDVSPEALATHSFWPLLGFTSKERRVKKEQGKPPKFTLKERDIRFGSHNDAAILSKYSRELASLYERTLKERNLGGLVLAYRSGIGNNVSQAKSLFDEIKERASCTFLGLDIMGFFDHIRHDVLRDQLSEVFGDEHLNTHDYKVFRYMTRFCWVEKEAVSKALKGKKTVKGRLCTPKEFRTEVRPKKLLRANEEEFGIPQGTPLSGLYANISMLDFDSSIRDFCDTIGASYRRYSDDLAFVLPPNVKLDEFIGEIEDNLKAIGLSISKKKTECAVFSKIGNAQESEGRCQYLGFTYDGDAIRIRESSLQRYYKKMRRGIHAKLMAAKSKDVARENVYRRQLLKRYTHFGYARNFPRYAYYASGVMDSPQIRKQLSRHMEIFRRVYADEKRKVFGI